MTERAIIVAVKGRVQGVGYRAFVQAAARRLGATGWVVNRHDGSVEAAFHGPGAVLAELVAQLRRGPEGAHVDALDLRSSDRGAIAEAPPDAVLF